MRGPLEIFLASLLLWSAAARAETPQLKVPFERYQLPNGLVVILHEDHRAPTVVVDLWFRVGSKDERTGRSGFAHLFEHLMFMGTKAVPNGQYDGIMEAAGGSNNASTSEDRTNYFETGPAHLLETFLWLEADRLASLPDDMTKEKLDLQRDVVKNERRQSYENRPYGKADLALSEHMYKVEHPYHHPVIGSHEDLTAASVADVTQFFRTFYVPSNASLVIGGDFRSDEAKRMVERYFAPLPKQPEPPHAAPAPAKLARSEKVVLEDAVELERAILAWHSPAAFAPGDGECDLLAAVLGSGKSSRLHRALVYEKKIAASVSVEQRTQRHGSLFVITATAVPGHTAAELEKAIGGELARLKAAPATAEEVERARTLVETQTLRAVERTFTMADQLNSFEFFFGDPGQLEKRLLLRYEAATTDGVRAQCKLLDAPRVSIHVVPMKKTGETLEKGKTGKKAAAKGVQR